jgi:hypothetical protein
LIILILILIRFSQIIPDRGAGSDNACGPGDGRDVGGGVLDTEIKPDSRASDAIETVIERRHQNGRWPLNLLHPEHIPLEMETGVGRASRWNTLRVLRVRHWYNNSTC